MVLGFRQGHVVVEVVEMTESYVVEWGRVYNEHEQQELKP
jgi:hypothetical protein